MGLLDALLGRTKPVRANLDALFALPSAAVTLETAAGLVSSGGAGICWKPPAGQSAAQVQQEINELLQIPDDLMDDPASGVGTHPDAPADARAGPDRVGADPGAEAPGAPVVPGPMTQAEDAFGYRWLLLRDPSIEELVTRVHLVNSSLQDNGWGPQLLCSVFAFVPAPGADPDTRGFNLVYLYKRGTFYPFAPAGKEHRDTELELRMKATLGSDLPLEQDLSRWFPLWDLPVT